MTEANIAFIGAGNIAGALVQGLITANYPADRITISNPTVEKLSHFAEQLGVHVTQDNQEAVKHADIIILAVKPQIVPIVCKELKAQILERNPLLISVASGVTTQHMEKWLSSSTAIVRAMPNTPLSVGAGATGLYTNAQTTEQQKEQAEKLFRSAGVAVWVESEADIDVVIAVSGSGPAYYFLMMEHMQAAAEHMGLSKEMARLLTSQTVLGAVRMVMESEQDLEQLRASVTSPNGTTSAALAIFENADMKGIMLKAMEAARHRSQEMAEALNKTE